MRCSRGVSSGVAFFLALLWVLPAVGGGFSNLDFGIRRMGMFAVTAKPDDGTAIFHNPAGMTLQEGTILYHSQSWFIADLGFRMYDSEGKLWPDHEITPDWSVGVIPFIGVTSDLGLEDLRLGLGIYAPNAYGAALPKSEPSRYHATRALFLAARATLAAAYRVTPRFSVGASISVVPVYLTASRVMNPLVLQDPDNRFAPPEVTAPFDATLDLNGLAVTWAWDVGVLLHPFDNFSIGLGFASGSDFTLKGDVTLTQPDGTRVTATQRTRMVIPFTLRAGFNWEFVRNFEVAMDIYWWHYQILQEQRTRLSEPIMGIGELVDPKNYGNSWNWCIGLLYRVHPRVELMVGYQEDYTPIPTRTFTLDNPSRDQRGISMGIRWQVNDSVRLGAAYVRNWFDLPDVRDSISMPPSNIKGYGGNNEVGIDVQWNIL